MFLLYERIRLTTAPNEYQRIDNANTAEVVPFKTALSNCT